MPVGLKLMIEGMAQTGGILLGEKSQFQHAVILGKINKAVFHSWVIPGDTLTYTAKLLDVRDGGGLAECQAHVGDRLVADAEIVFAHLDRTAGGPEAMDHKKFVFTMKLLGVFDVGRAGDGTSIPVPAT